MLEGKGVVDSHRLKITWREPVSQDTSGMPVPDKIVMEVASGSAELHELFGVRKLLQQDVIDRWQAVLEIPDRAT